MKEYAKDLSIVISIFNEEESLPELIDWIHSVLEKQGWKYEIIMIDDGSTDGSWAVIQKLAGKDSNIRGISFRRNYGKSAALYCGFKAAEGRVVVTMDADLQDPPSLLPEMFGYLWDGYDQAATRRVTRKGEPPIRSFFARQFYKLINKFSKTEIVDGARDFRLMKRCVVDAILSVKEYNRFSKGIFEWVGFKTRWIEFENVERKYGETKWSFWKLFVYAMDGIVAYSTVPLAAAAFAGGLFCVIAFLMIVFVIIRKLIMGDPTSGWPSLVCIILMVSGIQLLCLGVIGQYLSKTYLEVKNRPIYITKEELD